MKDDSGHMGDDAMEYPAPAEQIKAAGVSGAEITQPRTRDESAQWMQAYKARPVVGEPIPPSTFLPLSAAPTAWQSIPKAVRFAIWIFALWVIIGFGMFCAAVVAWMLGMGFALSQM